jgi:hypothetical protein
MKNFTFLSFLIGFIMQINPISAQNTAAPAKKAPRFDPENAVVARLVDGRMSLAANDSLLIESAQKGIRWLGRVDKIRFEKNGSRTFLVFWGWCKDEPLKGFNASILLKAGDGDTFVFDKYTSCCMAACSGTCGSGSVACGACAEGNCVSITSASCMMTVLEAKE